MSDTNCRGLCPKCLLWEGLSEEENPESESPSPPSGVPGPQSESEDSSPGLGSAPPGEGKVFGDYELLEELGRGGMGVVYKARQKSLNRIVALKMLLFEPRAGPGTLQRFQAEAEAAAGLQHPNIVAIHEVGIYEGQHYFTMDYVVGESLAQLAGLQPLAARRAAGYLRTIAQAVHHAHQHGILHRDLKPSNILIDAQDQPHITDFGLAKRLDDSGFRTPHSTLTLSGQVLGSPSYIPPEQALGKRGKVSRQSDVYALGAMLYHLLTGRPPFQGETITETLQQVLNTEPVAPRWLHAGIPRDLETICLKCLEKEMSRRYASAQALAEDLGRFLEGRPILARPVGTAGKVWRWCGRRPALTGMGTALALTFLIGLAGVLWQLRKAEENARRAEAGEYAANIGLVQSQIAEKNFDAARETLLWRTPERYRGWEWGWLQRQCNQDLMALPPSMFARFDPNTRVLAVGGPGTSVCFWDLANERQLGACCADDAWLYRVAYSPDGRQLAAATPTQPVAFVWDLVTCQLLYRLSHPDMVAHVAFSPDAKKLATACWDGRVRIWDTERGVVLEESPDYGDHVYCAEFSPDGCQVAYCGGFIFEANSRNTDVCLWDLGSRNLRRLEGHTQAVTQLAWHPRTNLLASCGWDRQVLLWDTLSGRRVHRLSMGANGACLQSLAFSPDGSSLGVVGTEAPKFNVCALVLEVPTLQPLYELAGNTGFLSELTFSPNGKYIATAGYGEPARIWPASAIPAHLSLEGHNQPVWSMAFSGNGRWLATGGLDQTVKIWEVSTGTLLRNLVPAFPVLSLSFSPDSSRLVTVGPDSTALIWKMDLDPLPPQHAPEPAGTLFAALDSRRRILPNPGTASPVPTITEPIQRLTGHTGAVLAVAWSPAGRWIATGSKDETARIWEAATGRLQATLRGHSNRVLAVAFAPSGALLATGSADKTIRLWEVGSGRCLRTLTNHTDLVLTLAFSPDGSRLASGGADTKLRLWELRSGRELYSVTASPSGVASLAFSPDGTRLVTAASSLTPTYVFGRETRVRFWDAVSGKELFALAAHPHTVCSVAFSPDGRWLATGSADQTARLWQAFPWHSADYPGPAELSLPARIEAYKRLFWRTNLMIHEAARLVPTDPGSLRRTVKQPFGDFVLPPAGSKIRPLRPIPPRPLQAGPNQLDLTTNYNVALNESWQPVGNVWNADTSLSAVPSGLQTYGGVAFDVRGLIQLRLNAPDCELFPERVTIPVQRAFAQLHVLHGLRWDDREGRAVAGLVLRYRDGTEATLPIELGVHLRGGRDPNAEKKLKECPRGELVWLGSEPTNNDEVQLRVYKTTFPNPRPAEPVQSIDYVSRNNRAAPFLLALTVE